MQPPNDPQATRKRWVPMSEAVEILSKPESSIRRLISQGRLTGEQVLRDPDNPRDTRLVWRVLIEDSPSQPSPPAADSESAHQSAMRHDPPDLTLPLLAKIEERDAMIAESAERERTQADRIAALEREIGRRESEATHAQQIAEIERERRVEADQRAARAEALAAARAAEVERERQETKRLRGRSLWDILRGK